MKRGKAENALNTTFKSCRTCSHTGSSGQTAGVGVPMFSSKPHGAHGALEKTKKCRHPGSEEEPQQQTSRRPKRQFPAFEIHGITFISFSLLPLMFFFSPMYSRHTSYVCGGFAVRWLPLPLSLPTLSLSVGCEHYISIIFHQ